MSNRRGAIWAMLALLGIVLAAGLTLSVVRLAGEHIGLASAPISVVRGLAPAPGGAGTAPPEHDVTRTVTSTVTVSRTVTVTGSVSGGVSTTGVSATTGTAAVTVNPQVTAATRPAAASTTATSSVAIRPPTGTSSKGSEDGRQDSRQSSSGRDD